MDFQDVSFVDGILEDVCARFEQMEVVILGFAFSVHFAVYGILAPDLIAQLMVELASSGVPFFELLCVVERLDEKLLLALGVQPLPEFLW